jgi:hypothetical protein
LDALPPSQDGFQLIPAFRTRRLFVQRQAGNVRRVIVTIPHWTQFELYARAIAPGTSRLRGVLELAASRKADATGYDRTNPLLGFDPPGSSIDPWHNMAV